MRRLFNVILSGEIVVILEKREMLGHELDYFI